MSVRILPDEEAQAILSNHPEITPDVIPTWGLRIVENGRDYLIGINHNTGEIKVIDLTYIDPETGRRVSMTEAQIKAFLYDYWQYRNPLSAWISEQASKAGVPEWIITIAVVVGGLWLISTVKNILR